MRAYERLLKYVSIYTTSDPDSATVPSSMRQYDLARILVDELNALGRAAKPGPRSASSPIWIPRRTAPAKM